MAFEVTRRWFCSGEYGFPEEQVQHKWFRDMDEVIGHLVSYGYKDRSRCSFELTRNGETVDLPEVNYDVLVAQDAATLRRSVRRVHQNNGYVFPHWFDAKGQVAVGHLYPDTNEYQVRVGPREYHGEHAARLFEEALFTVNVSWEVMRNHEWLRQGAWDSSPWNKLAGAQDLPALEAALHADEFPPLLPFGLDPLRPLR